VVQPVQISLTRHIASTLDDLQDEIRYSFDKEFGPCEDWTPITVYGKMTRVIALLSGRVFVGRPLSREEEWIQAAIMFTFYCHQAKEAISAYPEWARGIAAYFLPEVKRLWEFRERGAKLLQPILDAQMAKTGKEKIHRDDSQDEQGTFISWMLNFTNEDQRRDPLILANNQMGRRCSDQILVLTNYLQKFQYPWLPSIQPQSTQQLTYASQPHPSPSQQATPSQPEHDLALLGMPFNTPQPS
jgi:hypothetical protein